MKITELKTFVVGNAWKNWVFVKVLTDEGLVGVGEATGGLSTKPGEAQVHELSRFVVGRDPRNPEYIRDVMYKGVFLETNVGIAAVETACWDILGKSLGVPVWQLLGGKQRPRLRAYANGWYQGPRDPGFFSEAASRVREMGYTALKFDPFGSAYRFMDRQDEKFSMSIVRAVKLAVGPAVDILIEGHDRFSVSTAIRIGRMLEEFEPFWFETPVMSTDIAATIEVARAIPVPVAAGERISRLSQMIDLVAPRVVDIVQPEILNVGGISGARKMAAVAEAAEASVALHQAQSPLNTSINAHIHVSIPNFLIQECFDDFHAGWASEIMTGAPKVIGGYIEPSDKPGLGVELNETEMAKYPFGHDNFLRLFEDGWELRGRRTASSR
jgi:galactonate dehydratase